MLCNEYIKQLILEEFGLVGNDVDVTFVTDSSLDCKCMAKIDTNKKYTFEDVLAMFSEETEDSRIIDKFMQHLKKSIEYIKATDEFKTVDMQRYLKCGYGDTGRILDALLLLGIITKIENTSVKFKVVLKGENSAGSSHKKDIG